MDWLEIHRGDQPLVVGLPHSGTEIPPEIAAGLASPALARRDADWWIDRLYDFAASLGATTVRTRMSRTVIDVNRDPSGASLYPGMTTTELCPTTTFDGEPLYLPGQAPDAAAIAKRRGRWFEPYHAALQEELARLWAAHGAAVLYDAHSIRSRIPRMFDGELPVFNIGTNSGASCGAALARAVERVCGSSGWSFVRDGRFKGGWTTRHHGRPGEGVHAIQMELACRAYVDETVPLADWPAPYDPAHAAPARNILAGVLTACLDFAKACA